ncbi:tachylectin-related carbohydrate-binding protein [Saccharothrix sp. Mg75]|uniref:tachylectin-related carbohydrate-binding protein n=1 Tax=Saccharothrix sp. Mg75 TaxID=3445357 RepID=UPI003EE8DCCE
MRRSGSTLPRNGLGLALSALLATSLAAVPTHPASAAATLTCHSAALVVGVQPNGDLWHYAHNEPETGVTSWGAKVNAVGRGWHIGRTVAGPGGVVYLMVDNATGDLRRYHWTGTAWEMFNGTANRVVGTGWSRYSQAEHRNKVTVDEKGRLYEIAADGSLKVRIWQGDDATGDWTPDTRNGKVIDTGWGQYDLVVAAGDGVLYARKPDGLLFRYRWHAASNRFVKHAQQVGRAWGVYNRIFSPGGDVLYASRANNGGELMWYRWYEEGDHWAVNVGTKVGTGFYGELDVTANADSCRLTGLPTPTRPSVPVRREAPITPVVGPDGHLSYFYVNAAGGLTAARQRNAGDFVIIDYHTFPEHHGFTGRPGAGVRSDGRFEVLANSSDDASYRGKTGAGAWSTTPLVDQGGWMVSDPVLVRQPDGSLTAYAVDAAGTLHRRTHSTWFPLGTGPTAEFTVVANGAEDEVVARFPDGGVRAATVTGGVLGAWRAVGPDAVGTPAAVVHANGDLQVFVRRSDGTVDTQREVAGAFPGTWASLGDFVAAGPPAAVVRGGGLVELAVRGTDGFVHQAGQLAPAGGFGDWAVRYFEDTATDPGGAVLPDGSPIFTWRTPQGLIATVHAPAGAVPTGDAPTAFRGTSAG